jgi:hypothetical protein
MCLASNNNVIHKVCYTKCEVLKKEVGTTFLEFREI